MNKNSNVYIESSRILPLTDLSMGKKCKVKTLTSSGSGDPVAYLIRGAVIAIRKEDASNILVEAL